jgi:hypothetical protein
LANCGKWISVRPATAVDFYLQFKLRLIAQ